MLRSDSFDFEAQFHHAQEGYSDSHLQIDNSFHMDPRLERKIIVCQKRFHRYQNRAPPLSPSPQAQSSPNHSSNSKSFMKHIPGAFKTFIARTSHSQPSSNVPLRLNRLHGARHSRLSVLSPGLRKEFRRMSYESPQSSRVVVDLNKNDLHQSSSQSDDVPMQHFSNEASHMNNTTHHQLDPSHRDEHNEEYFVELQETSADRSIQERIPDPPERPRTPPVELKKPTEHPINISTLIHQYDNEISPTKTKHLTIERPSLSPEAQHRFVTIRELFENLADHQHISTSKTPPRSQTAPVISVKSNKAASLSPEPRLPSPATSDPSHLALEQRSQDPTKRYGTRHAPPIENPASLFEQDKSATEHSFLSSVTASPYDDPFLSGAELREEERAQYPPVQGNKSSETQESPERMNLEDLFDSLQVSADDDGAAEIVSPNPRAAEETNSTVARLIEKYGGINYGDAQPQKTYHVALCTNQLRDKRREVEQTIGSQVQNDEDEIQKVYKTANNPVRYRNPAVERISQREGGVEAIPWEVRLKSFSGDGTEAVGHPAELKSIEQIQATDAHERVKSFSLHSGSDQHSKPRSRSDTRGRLWHTRQPSALNKSWVGRAARQQAQKVKRQVGTMKNMISADDY